MYFYGPAVTYGDWRNESRLKISRRKNLQYPGVMHVLSINRAIKFTIFKKYLRNVSAAVLCTNILVALIGKINVITENLMPLML